jgi:hypothetical protein
MPALFVRAAPVIAPWGVWPEAGEVSRWPDPLRMPGRRCGALPVRSPGGRRSGVAEAVVRFLCSVVCGCSLGRLAG